MAKHVRPGLGEITYYFCPLGRAFPRWIPTPMWYDRLAFTRLHRLDRWLSTHWIVRGRAVHYD